MLPANGNGRWWIVLVAAAGQNAALSSSRRSSSAAAGCGVVDRRHVLLTFSQFSGTWRFHFRNFSLLPRALLGCSGTFFFAGKERDFLLRARKVASQAIPGFGEPRQTPFRVPAVVYLCCRKPCRGSIPSRGSLRSGFVHLCTRESSRSSHLG